MLFSKLVSVLVQKRLAHRAVNPKARIGAIHSKRIVSHSRLRVKVSEPKLFLIFQGCLPESCRGQQSCGGTCISYGQQCGEVCRTQCDATIGSCGRSLAHSITSCVGGCISSCIATCGGECSADGRICSNCEQCCSADYFGNQSCQVRLFILFY